MSESGPGGPSSDSGDDDKGSSVTCWNCTKEYASNRTLIRHMRDCCPEKLEQCPKCGKRCLNDHGVKAHYASSHEGTIAGMVIECEQCGENTRVREDRDRRYCSIECYRDSLPEREEVSCDYCGDTHTRKPSHVYDNNFCSQECFNDYLSNTDARAGANNPRYDPNSHSVYGENWEEQREKARKRDEYTCQSCGVHEDNHERELSVHHIVPRSEFIENGEFEYEKANKLKNLTTLCWNCHKKWEGIPLKPTLI